MPRLTERAVRAAKPRKRNYELTCSELRGFLLRVLPSGKKVYYVRFRRDGKDARERIGLARDVEFGEALERARDILFAARQNEQARRAELDGDDQGERYHPEPVGRYAPHRRSRARVPTLREFVPRYLAQHVDARLKPSTRAMYRHHLKHALDAFAHKRLDRLTREQVEVWHASMRHIPSAANNALRVLRGLYTKALDWDVLDHFHRNPTKGVRMFRENHRERFLTPEERARLERALREGEQLPVGHKGALNWFIVAAIRLLSLTGMRRAEVLGLEWSMVDFRHRCFRLPDSKVGQRVIPIGAPVLELINELDQRRQIGIPHVIYSTVGKPLDPATLGKSWRSICDRIGLRNLRLHDLRHSAASDALMKGVPLAVVGKILGHKKPGTTARYAHISDQLLRDAVEVMAETIIVNFEPS